MLAAATAPSPAPVDWLIFAIVYLGIAIGTIPFTRLSRAAIALLGAIAVVAFNRLDFKTATGTTIDWTTLALLFSLMLLAASLRVAGFYAKIIQLILDHAAKPWTLLIGIVAASALLSAVFANDIICLAFTPILASALQQAGKKPIPYLIALATSSNIGSAATIIGNPQNMLIGQSAHLNFAHFTLIVLPLVLACLILNVLTVAFIYRKEMFTIHSLPASRPDLLPPIENQKSKIENPPRPWPITKSLLITTGLVAAFLFTPIPREITALVAAGLVLISRTQDPRKLFALVDWDLILLFIGLFVVIGNVQQHGLLTGAMTDIQARVPLYQPLPFSLVTLLLSNIVSNVPAVLLLMPGLHLPTATDPGVHSWYLLAVVSTFAGNFTLLGSIANLIVAEQAKPLGIKLTFLEYLKTGLPLTFVTTALAVAYFTWLV